MPLSINMSKLIVLFFFFFFFHMFKQYLSLAICKTDWCLTFVV